MKYALTDKQKEYLRRVYRVLFFKVTNPYIQLNDLTIIQCKVEIEFINKVLGDLFYTEEDRSRLNELRKVYEDGSK